MSKRIFRTVIAFARRIGTDSRGNVLLITGFAILMLTFATGMGVDYSRAMKLQSKLNAAADAAALAAVTQPMMLQNNSAASTAAKNMFNTQASNLPGLIIDLNNGVTVTVTGNDNLTTTRTAVVTYTAQSTNAFAGILNMASLTIGGSSTATATAAPNIDFYLALDTSPSMALPTTTAGIASMDSQFTCSFACHSNKIENYYNSSIKKGLIVDNSTFNIVKGNYGTGIVNGYAINKIDANGSYVYTNATVQNTINSSATSGNGTKIQTLCKAASSNNNICVYNSDGTFVDSYWYALNQGIDLRVTAERSAVGDLMMLATSYAAANQRTYRAALYTFDYSTNLKTIASLTSDLNSITAASSKIDVVQVNDRAGNGCPPSPLSCGPGTYLFTSFKSVMDKMTSDLPVKSGKGTNTAGDTPQAFLFLVTDGMSDENIGSGRTRAPMQQAQVDQCTAIKNRGIKIAILYTEYTVASIQDDEPGQRAIATTAINTPKTIADRLNACASSPDLMYTVKTDESISTALQSLFTKAVATARLSK